MCSHEVPKRNWKGFAPFSYFLYIPTQAIHCVCLVYWETCSTRAVSVSIYVVLYSKIFSRKFIARRCMYSLNFLTLIKRIGATEFYVLLPAILLLLKVNVILKVEFVSCPTRHIMQKSLHLWIINYSPAKFEHQHT